MFKIIWDKENNGVKLTMKPGDEALNVSPRPVFYEELDVLGLDKKGWIYPKSKEPLLWACDRRYFYKGILVLEVKGGNVYDEPKIEIAPEGQNLSLTPIDMQKLRDDNQETMFLLEHEAMDFIDSTYRKYKNIKRVTAKNPQIDFQTLAAHQTKRTKKEHVVVREDCDSFDVMPLSEAEKEGKQPVLSSKIDMFISSFSGGKDSEVLLDLVSRVVPSNDLVVIYSDTGYELPSSLALFTEVEKYYKAKYPRLRFELAKNHKPVLYYWDRMGSPSNIHRWCCSVMKTAPLYIDLKKLYGKGRQPHVMSFVGTRADESLRRSHYTKIAKDAKHNNVINVSPILEWNTTEVWMYLLFHNLPFNEAYKQGLGRVGCVTCPFGSEWNDHLCNKLYPKATKPFLDKLTDFAKKSNIKDTHEYIRKGSWKIRAGGRGFETKSNVLQVSTFPDFKAVLSYPKENIFEWIKTLGKCAISQKDNEFNVDLRYDKKIFNLKLIFNDEKSTITISVKNVDNDIVFVSHLRKVLNKATYCVNCELCEVECPTGALSVYPKVKIDAKKCINCHRCLDFHDDGCITANSIKKSEGIKMDKNKKTTINRYNNFGFRDKWLNYYLNHYQTYFENDDHGLNVENQLKPFMNWLRDGGILENTTKEITETGKILASKYNDEPNTVWEIIWINLTHNSEICGWYSNTAAYNRKYTKLELETQLQEDMPQYSASVRKNAFGALQNAFTNSPLGEALQVGRVVKEKNKPVFLRGTYSDVSLAAVAYSLYKYAENQNRHDLTISELYNENQTDGLYRQFGIDKESLEKKLRTLQEESHHVLSADLNMGLDNINLRDDLTSLDVLKMLL